MCNSGNLIKSQRITEATCPRHLECDRREILAQFCPSCHTDVCSFFPVVPQRQHCGVMADVIVYNSRVLRLFTCRIIKKLLEIALNGSKERERSVFFFLL